MTKYKAVVITTERQSLSILARIILRYINTGEVTDKAKEILKEISDNGYMTIQKEEKEK